MWHRYTWSTLEYNHVSTEEHRSVTGICVKSSNKRASLHTRGSGDPSSGCICNAAGSDISVIKFYSLCQHTIYYVVCSIGAGAETYLSQTEQWWHRSGFSSWQRSQKRIAEETQSIQSQRHQQQLLLTLSTQTNWVDGDWNEPWGSRLFQLPCILSAVHKTGLCCTSRVSASVDGQILGYPSQDLLLRLSPIFTLQQLFVRVGKVELWRADRKTKQQELFVKPVLFSKPLQLSIQIQLFSLITYMLWESIRMSVTVSLLDGGGYLSLSFVLTVYAPAEE